MPKITPLYPQGQPRTATDGMTVRQLAIADPGWVTLSEAANLEGVTKSAMRMRLKRRPGEYRTRQVGKRVEIAVECLSPGAQMLYAQLAQAEAEVIHADAQARALTLPDGTLDTAAMLAAWRESDLSEVARRSAAVAALEAALAQAAHGEKCGIYAQIAEQHGISERTLRRWEREERLAGKAAHSPGRNRRKGHGSRAMSAELRALILAHYNTERRLSPKQLLDNVALPYCRDHGERVPSAATIARFLRESISPLEEIAFRHGRRAYEAQAAPKVERDLSTVGVYEILCGDCRKLDVMVIAPDGRIVRPWIAAWVDVRTGLIAGWVLGLKPNTRLVALALRNALVDIGIPAKVYTDNGHEYVNRFWGKALRNVNLDDPAPSVLDQIKRFPATLPLADEAGIGGLFAVLDIERITAIPKHPWSKPIESIFNAFFSPRENLLPGWCGRDAKDKPEVLAKQIEKRSLLTLDQMTDVLAGWVKEWNTSHCVGKREMPPLGYFERFTPRRVLSEQALDVLLSPIERKKITQKGLEVCGRLYQSEELQLHVQKCCQARYDPQDMRAVTMFVKAPEGLKRLAVPLAPRASWQGDSVANTAARRGRRRQLDYLRAVFERDKPYREIGYGDPDGAVAMIAERKASEAEAAARQAADEALNATLKLVEQDTAAEREEREAAIERAAKPRESATTKLGKEFFKELKQFSE